LFFFLYYLLRNHLCTSRGVQFAQDLSNAAIFKQLPLKQPTISDPELGLSAEKTTRNRLELRILLQQHPWSNVDVNYYAHFSVLCAAAEQLPRFLEEETAVVVRWINQVPQVIQFNEVTL